ncbi:MAG: ABC transporter permease, partial [bacterium]|nr:ABC transporter permease [bacterium]
MSTLTQSLHRLNEAGLHRNAARERWVLLGLTAPAVIAVTIIMVMPVTWLFYLSFLADDGSFSFENYIRMVESKSYARIFMTTFKVSVYTTGICI